MSTGQSRGASDAEVRAMLRDLTAWIGATAEMLAQVPRPQGHSRTLIDAVEGGRAWVRKVRAAGVTGV